MTEYNYDMSIAFLESDFKIPESYFRTILDLNAIRRDEEPREYYYLSNIRNAELQSIVTEEPAELATRNLSVQAFTEQIFRNNINGVKRMFEKLQTMKIFEKINILDGIIINIILTPKAVTYEMADLILSHEDIFLNDYLSIRKTPLEFAIESKKMEMIKVLIERGADVNMKHVSTDEYRNWTPLLFAIYSYPNSIGLLLSKGANVRYKLPQASSISSQPVEVEIIAYVMNHLLETYDVGTLLQLIEAGADVNARDAGGWTLLMLAAQKGNYTFIRTLVDLGADNKLTLPDTYIEKDWTAYNVYRTAHSDLTIKPKDYDIIKNLLTKSTKR